MSQQRRIVREMKQYEERLSFLVSKKSNMPHTEKPRMAVAGNNPSSNKRARARQHQHEQLVKLARVVVACLITAAGGGHKAEPVAVDRSAVLKLDAYHSRIYARGTVISLPGFIKGKLYAEAGL